MLSSPMQINICLGYGRALFLIIGSRIKFVEKLE